MNLPDLPDIWQRGGEQTGRVPWYCMAGPKGEISQGLPQAPISLDEVPFIYEEYENMMPFENRILYYETSRGCPFSCSYCLSSIDKRVRLRSMELVEKELQFFLDHKVPQVKFVDRTFNCNHRHSMAIWRYIKEHDNGITNFHFEIAADILNEEEMGLLATFRPDLPSSKLVCSPQTYRPSMRSIV